MSPASVNCDEWESFLQRPDNVTFYTRETIYAKLKKEKPRRKIAWPLFVFVDANWKDHIVREAKDREWVEKWKLIFTPFFNSLR